MLFAFPKRGVREGTGVDGKAHLILLNRKKSKNTQISKWVYNELK